MSFPFKQVRSLSRGLQWQLQWQCGTRSAATLLPHYLKQRHHYYHHYHHHHHHHHHHTCGRRVSERGFTTATTAATGTVTGSDTATESALAKLVHALELRDLDAFVVPTADPHLGEYSALRYARREFISGFTGSAGTALVMKSSQAYMWTDGRYFHQAESELSAAWQLMKSGEKGVPSLLQYLAKLPRGSTVGIDSSLHAATEVLEMKKCLENKGILMSSVNVNPIDEIWGEIQPSMPVSQVRTHPPRYAGQSISEKISSIKRKLFDSELMSSTNELQNVVLVLTELDEIAWTFNIRGGDVPHNPVVYSFALISNNSVSIFIDKGKLSPDTLNDLRTSDVSIYPYDDFKTNLSAIAAQNPDVKILVDKDTVNYSIYEVIPNECRINITSPIALLKACKNTSEIDGMVQCHRRDGAAVVAFLHWLSRYIVPTSTSISEVEIADKLTQFRRDYSPDTFIGHSFDTIAGVGGNGAIIHYRAVLDSCKQFTRHDLLLLDSGAQYEDGTTDVTRTIHLENATNKQIDVYTRVLMGHIDLASLVFPVGTPGSAIDAVARRHLWDAGLDYPHGTGHGVGAALCVHEGPQRIAKMTSSSAATPGLVEGMIVSIEPGYYEPHNFGVRLENLYVVSKATRVASSDLFLEFKPLTFIPFQRSLINVHLLSEAQLCWLNSYHDNVVAEISSMMKLKSELDWLHRACKPMISNGFSQDV